MSMARHHLGGAVGLACACWLAAVPVAASGLYLTDDADIAAPGTWQFDTFARAGPAGVQLWMLPAGQAISNVELTVGTGLASAAGPTQDWLVQLKTALRSLRTDDWGYGLVVGNYRRSAGRPGGGLPWIYAYVPVSVSLAGDRLLLHQNLGLAFNGTSGPLPALTWGVMGEWALTPAWAIAAEAFGDTRSAPSAQAGVRWWSWPGHVRLDAALLGQLGQPGAAVSVGVGFTAPGWP